MKAALALLLILAGCGSTPTPAFSPPRPDPVPPPPIAITLELDYVQAAELQRMLGTGRYPQAAWPVAFRYTDAPTGGQIINLLYHDFTEAMLAAMREAGLDSEEVLRYREFVEVAEESKENPRLISTRDGKVVPW